MIRPGVSKLSASLARWQMLSFFRTTSVKYLVVGMAQYGRAQFPPLSWFRMWLVSQ